MKVLDSYCCYEFFVMLTIGTTIPGGIYLLTEDVQRLLRYVAEAGCPVDLLVSMTALQIPSTAVTCLPAGVLMATILALHFMNANSEVLAMRTAGISSLRIFRPFLVIAVLCAALSFLVAEELVPDALKLSNNMAIRAINERELPPCHGVHDYVGYELQPSGQMKTIFLVASRQGRQLFDNVIFDLSAPDHIRLIWAPKGLFKNQNWNLFDGHIYDMLGMEGKALQHQHFGSFKIGPPDLSSFDPKKREPRPYEMNSRTLKAQIAALQRSGKPVPPDTYLEFFRRFTDPLACILLVFAAFPVVSFGRRNRNMNSLAYGGGLLVSYFIIRNLSSAAASSGQLEPLTAACLPGVIYLLFGIVLIVLRRRSI